MSLAVLYSCGLSGMQAHEVRVEVHIATGLPAFQIVGLPDVGIRESRERVRSALLCAGYEFPAARITVNLAPADLPKDSGRFDLPIALGVLLASAQLTTQDEQGRQVALQDLERYVLVGELSLSAAVVPVHAPLLIAAAMHEHWPDKTLVLPADSAGIAAHVPGVMLAGVHSLRQAADYLLGQLALPAPEPVSLPQPPQDLVCMSEIQGQEPARRALEVVAAGGHSLLMVGTPGVGKTMLAQRLPGLLPALSSEQSIALAAIHSLLHSSFSLLVRPPFRAPHHSASVPAIVGGGAKPLPGEISLAHHGILFLDEFPEFDKRALEALREPLEAGHICISRANARVQFPARFQLIAAMNPCPCGWAGHTHRVCRCSPERKQRYQQKVSGPILDRIDAHIFLSDTHLCWEQAAQAETSAQIRLRVEQARKIQWDRQQCLNSALQGKRLEQLAWLDTAGQSLLEQAVRRWHWSGRGRQRILRLARTVADMAGSKAVSTEHLREAIGYRPQGGLR